VPLRPGSRRDHDAGGGRARLDHPETPSRAGGFPGDAIIRAQFADGPPRKLVAIRPEGRAPARAERRSGIGGEAVGAVTSGGFGPTVGGPVALGYVGAAHAATGTALELIVRGKALPAAICDAPFVAHRYKTR
jgi:aminomethyltransferase